MSGIKGAHHRGDYQRRAAHVRAVAYADPTTRCWRCGLTLSQRRRTHPRSRWTAGHLHDGEVGGPLAPECSWCNYSSGSRLRWARARRARRTELTW